MAAPVSPAHPRVMFCWLHALGAVLGAAGFIAIGVWLGYTGTEPSWEGLAVVTAAAFILGGLFGAWLLAVRNFNVAAVILAAAVAVVATVLVIYLAPEIGWGPAGLLIGLVGLVSVFTAAMAIHRR
jgi:hypothetical protein